MKQIKYSYCIDDDNNLIHVLSLTNSTRHSRKLYCLQCGQEMVANLGTKKSWYFSHKSDCACDGESYLHKLAKRKIKEKFENTSTFPITFSKSVPCKDKDNCPIYSKDSCINKGVKIKSDLKYWNNHIVYDKCQEEIPVGDFRPDLLLTCSTKAEKAPVFIELFKTHQSSEKKLSSEYRIIETERIESESIIDDILERGFIEGENCTTYNFKPQFPLIKKNDVPIDRFVLFKNGAVRVYKAIDYEVYCDQINKKVHSDSMIELNMREQGIDIWGINEDTNTLDSYQKGLVYLVQKGMAIKNCILCKFYRYNDFYNCHICILYKSMGFQSPRPRQTMANRCQQYKINQELLNHSLAELEEEIFELQTES